jgi:hypothetical protein
MVSSDDNQSVGRIGDVDGSLDCFVESNDLLESQLWQSLSDDRGQYVLLHISHNQTHFLASFLPYALANYRELCLNPTAWLTKSIK